MSLKNFLWKSCRWQDCFGGLGKFHKFYGSGLIFSEITLVVPKELWWHAESSLNSNIISLIFFDTELHIILTPEHFCILFFTCTVVEHTFYRYGSADDGWWVNKLILICSHCTQAREAAKIIPIYCLNISIDKKV